MDVHRMGLNARPACGADDTQRVRLSMTGVAAAITCLACKALDAPADKAAQMERLKAFAENSRRRDVDLYDRLAEAGCKMDNHESDFYVLDTPEARAIVKSSPLNFSFFRSNLDGLLWIEVPFAYLPWWRARTAKPA